MPTLQPNNDDDGTTSANAVLVENTINIGSNDADSHDISPDSIRQFVDDLGAQAMVNGRKLKDYEDWLITTGKIIEVLEWGKKDYLSNVGFLCDFLKYESQRPSRSNRKSNDGSVKTIQVDSIERYAQKLYKCAIYNDAVNINSTESYNALVSKLQGKEKLSADPRVNLTLKHIANGNLERDNLMMKPLIKHKGYKKFSHRWFILMIHSWLESNSLVGLRDSHFFVLQRATVSRTVGLCRLTTGSLGVEEYDSSTFDEDCDSIPWVYMIANLDKGIISSTTLSSNLKVKGAFRNASLYTCPVFFGAMQSVHSIQLSGYSYYCLRSEYRQNEQMTAEQLSTILNARPRYGETSTAAAPNNTTTNTTTSTITPSRELHSVRDIVNTIDEIEQLVNSHEEEEEESSDSGDDEEEEKEEDSGSVPSITSAKFDDKHYKHLNKSKYEKCPEILNPLDLKQHHGMPLFIRNPGNKKRKYINQVLEVQPCKKARSDGKIQATMFKPKTIQKNIKAKLNQVCRDELGPIDFGASGHLLRYYMTGLAVREKMDLKYWETIIVQWRKNGMSEQNISETFIKSYMEMRYAEGFKFIAGFRKDEKYGNKRPWMDVAIPQELLRLVYPNQFALIENCTEEITCPQVKQFIRVLELYRSTFIRGMVFIERDYPNYFLIHMLPELFKNPRWRVFADNVYKCF